MNGIFLNQFNIAMETIVLVFMTLLFIFCLIQKKEQPFLQKLNHMVFCMILVLIVQIAQWQMEITLSKEITSLLVSCKKFLIVSDFSLLYFLDVSFYSYLTYHIEYQRAEKGDIRTFPQKHFYMRIAWGILITLLFASSLWTGYFYQFHSDGMITASESYLLILFASFLCPFSNAIITMRNRKVLGLRETMFMVFYFLFPLLMIVTDLLHNTCYGYIAKAISVFIIFLGIDLQHGNLILKQKLIMAEQKETLTRQRTTLMLSQIQPHFLYNTLAVIDYLCEEDPVQARKVIGYFSRYLRTNMGSIQSDAPISFEKELSHVQGYLSIEQIRYGDILRVEYDIQEKNFKLPPLTLQPLVENAVRHGIRSRMEGGTVTISTRRDGKMILITIKDDGMGFDPEQIPLDERPHVGLKNVKERIRLLCSGEVLINSKIGEGTEITIRIEET